MNKIIKFILKLPMLTRTKFIHNELHILDFVKLLTKFTIKLVFKYKHI